MIRKVLFYGASMLADIHSLGEWKVSNQSIPGYTLPEAEQAETKEIGLSMLLQEDRYDALILCIGSNDLVIGDLRASEICQKVIHLVEIAKKNMPKARILVFGFPFFPTASRNLRYLLNNTFTGDQNVMYMPFIDLEVHEEYLHEDGIHLNEKGNQFVAQEIRRVLQ